MKDRGVEEDSDIKDPKICFMGNYPPKECGIATFTRDLVTSMNRRWNPKVRSRVIALNDANAHYNYDNKVILEVQRDSPGGYKAMAKKVNDSPDHRLICIQHEFGIFGGNYGEDLLHFLDNVKKPVAITFHSVLPNPEPDRKKLVKKIAAKVSAIIVMAEAAVDILNRDYGIERSKMYVIHHGIPSARFIPPEKYKKKLNLDPNRRIILTFGLLSIGKGVEYMIKALPPLVKKYPDLLYLILGETHPDIVRREGEVYRNSLIKLINKLGLQNNVKFVNKYVTTPKLVEYILACDIYAFTNLERAQITSGTLAYAMGCGRPVVATPVVYAEELLRANRGIVIENFKNPEAFTIALDQLLEDPIMRKNMAEAAYAFGRQMTWPNVARRHLQVFNRVVKLREEIIKKYPTIKIEHMKKLTNNFGMIQFAKGSTPDKNSGYTVDDNTRALITAILHNSLTNSDVSHRLARIYLNFLNTAQEKGGYFKNNFKNENEVLDTYSDDALGRAIWALGYTTRKTINNKIQNKANIMFKKAARKTNKLKNTRSKAFGIMGLYHHYKKYKADGDLRKIIKLANDLVNQYYEHSTDEWNWFEDFLTYSNAKIPMSLFYTYEATGREKYLDVAEKTLHFLSDITFQDDTLYPIGQNGWFKKNEKRAYFDQQPIDASAMVMAYLTAFKVTKDKHYMEKASLAFNWFLGKNHLNQMLYDELTGGCFDGLGKHSLNLNQGAESTLSYLLARLLLEETKQQDI